MIHFILPICLSIVYSSPLWFIPVWALFAEALCYAEGSCHWLYNACNSLHYPPPSLPLPALPAAPATSLLSSVWVSLLFADKFIESHADSLDSTYSTSHLHCLLFFDLVSTYWQYDDFETMLPPVGITLCLSRQLSRYPLYIYVTYLLYPFIHSGNLGCFPFWLL